MIPDCKLRGEIVDQLASSLKRMDQQPNIDLAARLSRAGDKEAIAALMQLAKTGSKPVRYDAIKVIYEIGRIEPEMLLWHGEGLIALLQAKENRMIWGSLQALETLCGIAPKLLAANLNTILGAADRSSVIAMDKTMAILAKLAADERFSKTVTPVLLLRLANSAPNQFPTYAEMAAATIPDKNKAQLLKIIEMRQSSIALVAKRSRLQKLTKNLLKK